MFDPGFSETEEVRVMRVNEIRHCCRVDRVKNGTNVKIADREGSKVGCGMMRAYRRSR